MLFSLPMEIARTADLADTRSSLVDLARRRFGRISPERIADHVIAVTGGADWPVRKAAVEALARRFGFIERDGLRVEKQPPGILGEYQTARAGHRRRDPRGYRTALVQVSPLRTSCSCPDFVRSSLGLCKHGLVVLDLVEKKRVLTKLREPAPRAFALSWSPDLPLEGPVDRLAGLRLRPNGIALRGFQGGAPRAQVLGRPERRVTFIEELERLVRTGKLDAEPAVPTLLADERERAERAIRNHTASRASLGTMGSLRRRLYPYQREGVERFLGAGRLLLADDMGLGKTMQAIAACHALYAARRVKRGLLIVPAALKPQWKREWEATTDTPLDLVEGTPDERTRKYAAARRGFLMIGYEQLLRDFAHVQRFQPELVVLDEAQRIKNWATKSAGYVKALRPEFRLVLTGTPMENRFDELASLMDFVDDVALEPKWRLAPWHSIGSGDGGRGKMGARHLATLRARLGKSMLRRVRKEVLAQLPARTDTRVPAEMTEEQREEHAALDQPIAVLMSTAMRRPLTQIEFLRLMQLLNTQRIICNGLGQLRFEQEWPRLAPAAPTQALLGGLFSPKLAAFRGLVEQITVQEGRKMVVFSQWRRMLRLAEWSVRNLLGDAGLRAVFFTGAEKSKLREQAIVDFHDEPGCAVMFLSDAGGVGLNLQRAASCCVNLELPWNPAVLEQRIGRIHRLGQTMPIEVYNLVTEEGIEGRIAQLVANKKAVFSSLFDGTSDEVRFDGQHSFLEGMKNLLEPVAPPPEAPEGGEVDAEPAAEIVDSTLADNEPPLAEAAPEGARPTGLSVTRLPTGGVRIEAPPELAVPLADLLESLARSLRASVPDAATEPHTGRPALPS
jgi:superfamily II DNA or RNA helicase